MRLARLDLARYGRFTDHSLELPAGGADFHLVFGPNEAGKSTALAGIGDFLFGIPARSPYNFLHEYKDMRLGAVLEGGAASLEVFRRKGNRHTLLTADGTAVAGGESALAAYLGGADRAFFERMFSLDHSRLRAGGQEILEGDSDVGQVLFSAGAGITGLREHLRRLRDEASALWAPKKAKHREFYIADDKRKDAERSLREHTLTADKWRELKQAREKTEADCARIDGEIAKINAGLARLDRIRRVLRDVRGLQEIDRRLAGLQDTVPLPETAAAQLDEFGRGDAKAAARIGTLDDERERASKELEGLAFDEALVRRAADIRRLHERRIVILQQKEDLPRRQAEREAAVEDLQASAAELGWRNIEPTALAARIPPRTSVAKMNALLGDVGGLRANVERGQEELRKSRETHDRLEERLSATDRPVDASRLALVLETIRTKGDLAGRPRAAEAVLETADRQADNRLVALEPGGIGEAALAGMAVPARASVQDYRDRERDWRQRLREAKEALAASERELRAVGAARERAVRTERVVTIEELDRARTRRDDLWSLVKLHHVEGKPVPEDRQRGFEKELDDLVGAFEPAMAGADELADRRFDRAEAAGRLAEIHRKVGELETHVDHQSEGVGELKEEGRRLAGEWAAMWAAASFEPLAADAMLAWIDARKEALRAIETRQDAEASLERAQGEEDEAREALLSELAALGIDRAALEGDGLDLVAARAEAEARLRKEAADDRSRLEEDIRNAAAEAGRREGELERAEATLSDWRKQWRAIVGELGLDMETDSDTVGPLLDIVERMRDTAGRVRSLQRDRIDKIVRDIADFDRAVGEAVGDLAPDLADRSSEDAVLELEARLERAEDARKALKSGNDRVKALTDEIAELEDKRRQSAASIAHLKTLAGVGTDEALKIAIERSDSLRALEQDRRNILGKLEQDGDGKPPGELAAECDGAVMDEIVAREKEMKANLDDLQQQRLSAAEERSRAREAFKAVDGGNAAAQDAGRRQEALGEMQNAAERYVRARTSALLLQWAIDRYRREKQTPLLRRASGLFACLTGGSFARLQVEFDDKDNARLEGIRPGGERVAVSGLSDGTADQLYLALRVAAIEDYLKRANALPFIADDLFINFDNERAAAGFAALEELSRKTQVLFFTHHRHLVDIARERLGASLRITTLAA